MTPQELFVEIHDGLPRQGPGSDECTLRALRMLEPLRPAPRILDLGCGPGSQTLVLARETGGTVTAVDLHQPYLDEVQRRVDLAGLSDRVQTVRGSMDALEVRSSVYDLIWSEGAAYVIGVRRALEVWHAWVRPGGGLAFTELTWLTDQPAEEAARFWERHHPKMTDVQGNLEAARECGYHEVGHFVLPESAWWDEYYTPMEDRVKELRDQVAHREDLVMTLDEEVQEIEMFRRHSASYGYVFYVLRRV